MPVLDDNFAYLLTDEAGVTAAVDPAEAEKVRERVLHDDSQSPIDTYAQIMIWTRHSSIVTCARSFLYSSVNLNV